jgi:5'-phosphate synthase pdxT subunit
MDRYKHLTIGVLAIQGDFERHQHQLGLVGAGSRQVRLPGDIAGIDGLIIPGGESTTMNIMIDRFDLRRPLLEFARSRPVWGTCAGMIMLAKKIDDNISGVEPLGILDIDVLRNGYGRQVFSFEEQLRVDLGNGVEPLTATFIRAPRITRAGPSVIPVVEYKGSPVLVRSGCVMASSFHTELDDNTTLLEFFLTNIRPTGSGGAGP